VPVRKEDARFDAAYYRRFYGKARTRIHGAEEVAHLGAGLVEMIAWYGGDVRSVLEVGAGVGLLRDWFAKERASVRYVSTEYSAYAAATYGHVQRDIATWKGRQKFDLVVCQGVLPYLSDNGALAAIDNLAAMTRGFLYLEAITRRDYDTVCDREKTDPGMRLRPAAFYKKRLARAFQPVGGGLYYAKNGPLVFWELETT
jgi:Nodulation protein S (NodS)